MSPSPDNSTRPRAASASTDPGGGAAGSGGQSPRPANWQDVGAEISLPAVGLMVGVAIAAALVGLIAWPILSKFKPGGVPAIPLAAGVVVGAFLASTLAMRPWKPRRAGRLPMLWLAGRAVCFVSVLALGALVYFAPRQRPDPLSFGLVLAGAYFAALLAESVVMARRLRAPAG